jgi:SsrA-binding protein
MSDDAIKIITTNRKARHDYEIVDSFEAGISLKGSEVKSLRAGKASLVDSFARIKKGELYLENCQIMAYDQASYNNHDPRRDRKLLMHKNEIFRLIKKTEEKGLTLVALKLYFKKGRAKVEIALARGKRQYDKKEAIKKRDLEREMRRK